MQYISSVEIRQKFSEAMEEAKDHPVTIQKNGRDHVVMISVKKFKELQEMEDMMLGEIAKNLDKEEDYLSDSDSAKLLGKILNAQN